MDVARRARLGWACTAPPRRACSLGDSTSSPQFVPDDVALAIQPRSAQASIEGGYLFPTALSRRAA
jgi:hypothetical protein